MKEEEEELLAELGYDTGTTPSTTHKDSIFLHISFTLKNGSLTLATSPSSHSALGPESLVSLVVTSLCCIIDLKPRIRGATFELSLGDLSLDDVGDEDTIFPALIKPKGREVNVRTYTRVYIHVDICIVQCVYMMISWLFVV